MNENNINNPWTEQDSVDFINFGHYFIPEREYLIDTICKLLSSIKKQSSHQENTLKSLINRIGM